MKLRDYLSEGKDAYEISGEINRAWRDWNRKNRKAGFIENDAVVKRIGDGWVRIMFQYADVDAKWFEKQFLKKIKGIKKVKISHKQIDLDTV